MQIYNTVHAFQVIDDQEDTRSIKSDYSTSSTKRSHLKKYSDDAPPSLANPGARNYLLTIANKREKVVDAIRHSLIIFFGQKR